MKTMKDYHNLLLKCDLLLLADVYEILETILKKLWIMFAWLFKCPSFKLECNA